MSTETIELTEEEILTFNYIPTSNLKKQRRGHERRIMALRKERAGFLESKDIDANVERIRRDIRIEDRKNQLSEVNQILAYRLVNP